MIKIISIIILIFIFVFVLFTLRNQIKDSFILIQTKKFAVYAQFKNEGHVINEWIEHYLKEGADHIFLVDNGSTDNYKIEPKFNNNVTLIYNDKKHAQVELGEKYLKEHIRGKFKWVLVVDLDEFLFTKNYPSIRDYINKMEIENQHITCITVPWTMFGSSGHEKQPKSVVDNFLYRDAIDTTFQEGRYAKSLFQSYHKFDIHVPFNVNKKNTTLNFIPNQKSMPTIPKDIKIQENELQLNHYAVQSKDFFRNVKMTRGDIHSEKNENVRTLDYFKKYDKNEHFDNLLSTKRKKKSKIYLVMCRYKENLDYITKNPNIFDNFDKIIIYNKGNNDINIKDKKIEIIPSENLGNAEESYFKFIIDNYNLENVVVLFSSASFYEYKHDYKKNQFQFVLDRLLLTQNSIVPIHLEKNQSMKNFTLSIYNIFALNRNVLLTKSDIRPYSNWVENVLNISYKDVHYYSLYGIFAIHSSHWKNRSIDFYKKIHSSLYVKHPEVGHYIERGISYIFKLPNENLVYLNHENIFKIHKHLEFVKVSQETNKIKEIVKQFTGNENFSYSSLASRTSNVIKKGNIFIKQIHKTNSKFSVYEREKYIATLLKDYKWFPSLLYFDDKNKILVFKNVGNPIDKNNLPDDFFLQFDNILTDLKKLNIQHNDIKMEEILIDNEKNIYLSDFGWASINGNLNCGLNIWGGSNTEKPGGYHDDETFLSRNFNYRIHSETHLLIDWTNHFTNIQNYFPKNLKIIHKIKVDKLLNKKQVMSNFYRIPVDDFRGSTDFTIYIIKDTIPIYNMRKTSKGHRKVNISIFDLKIKLREITGGYKIHATDNIQETKDNLKVLGLYDKYYNQKNFNSLKDVFRELNKYSDLKWVVMRNFEGMPDKIHIDEHLDVDLLVNDYYLVKRILDSSSATDNRYEDGHYRILNYVLINNKKILFDFRSIGDNYYDKKFQEEILDSRIKHPNEFYIPNKEMHLYSLIYHAIIHKKNISNSYIKVMKNYGIRDFNKNNLKKKLDEFMKKKNYDYCKPELSVGFFR